MQNDNIIKIEGDYKKYISIPDNIYHKINSDNFYIKFDGMNILLIPLKNYEIIPKINNCYNFPFLLSYKIEHDTEVLFIHDQDKIINSLFNGRKIENNSDVISYIIEFMFYRTKNIYDISLIKQLCLIRYKVNNK
jgi:hypothetical protein